MQQIYSGLASLGLIGTRNREEIRTSVTTLKELLPHLDQLTVDYTAIKSSIKTSASLMKQIITLLEILIIHSPECENLLQSQHIDINLLKEQLEVLNTNVGDITDTAKDSVLIIKTAFQAFSGTGYVLGTGDGGSAIAEILEN